MKKLCFLIALLFVTTSSFAQASFDHMSLVVKDLEETIDFYTKVLGFKKIPDPTGVPTIDWVENDKGQQIHFSQGDISAISFPKSVHMSFGVDALAPFIRNLNELKIPYEDWPGEPNKITIRADGIRQIYFRDPNGYWIEINDRIQ